jgi:hypothetical protein
MQINWYALIYGTEKEGNMTRGIREKWDEDLLLELILELNRRYITFDFFRCQENHLACYRQFSRYVHEMENCCRFTSSVGASGTQVDGTCITSARLYLPKDLIRSSDTPHYSVLLTKVNVTARKYRLLIL